ncbi:MAG TPA: hypothetical protein ENN78_00890 [Candidatus Omnitrophica bacterium]|nr:hypothetical protein [Candidatus Omnitrophota bacterium]
MDEEHFDFAESEEPEDDLNFDDTIECPNCKNPVPKNSLLCLYCGKSVNANSYPEWLKITAVVIGIIFVLFAIFSLIRYI